MGLCHSSLDEVTAVPPYPEAPPQNKTEETAETDLPSPPTVRWHEACDAVGTSKRARPTSIKKGYSSGASSPASSDHGRSNHTRDNSDMLGIEEMKAALITDGTLSTNVVRMETPFGKSIDQVYDGVHDGEILGSGISGVVRLVTHRATGLKYAVKCLDLGLVKSDAVLDQMRDEIYIMLQLDHPNIVRLEEVYESTNEIYIVQELCLGGDLFDRLDMQPEYHYTEIQCAHLVKQMLSSVRYLHSKNIVHRDLKLENFLFSSPDADSALKMIDFGLSKHFQFGVVLHEAVGTPYAVAPEVIRGSYDERADMWSIGVLTYLLLSGETPFGGCDGEPLMEVRDKILSGDIKFEPEEAWSHVSDSAKAFVRLLLNPDPTKRPTAKEAQKLEWLTSSKFSQTNHVLDPNVVNALVNFKEQSDMRKLLSEVLSFTLLPEQIKGLQTEFEKIDEEGDGEISLSALQQVLTKSAESGSLGSLTEPEVEDIFNSLRVSKTDPKIRWHEFIAAGLSQCKVDDRNLKLAFDRLDTGGKGYITFNDLADVMGADGSDPALETIWKDGISQCSRDLEHIAYDDFVVIMKGQAPDTVLTPRRMPSRKRQMSDSKPELPTVDESAKDDELAEKVLVTPKPAFVKQRSRSMQEKRAAKWVTDDEGDSEKSSSRLLLSGRDAAEVTEVISDDAMSPLVVNRALYRSHRAMRIAVLEASKRFEEERARRAHAKRVALGENNGRPVLQRRASLVMKRGSLPDFTVVKENKAHQALLDNASERGGRPARRKRNRTVSDMTGMLPAGSVSDVSGMLSPSSSVSNVDMDTSFKSML